MRTKFKILLAFGGRGKKSELFSSRYFLSGDGLGDKFIVNLSEDTLTAGSSTVPCTYLP
jgi:hypothetical protein